MSKQEREQALQVALWSRDLTERALALYTLADDMQERGVEDGGRFKRSMADNLMRRVGEQG
jgi:hypothetical protein